MEALAVHRMTLFLKFCPKSVLPEDKGDVDIRLIGHENRADRPPVAIGILPAHEDYVPPCGEIAGIH